MSRHDFQIEDSRYARCAPQTILGRILTPASWPEWQSEILRVKGPDHLASNDVVRGDAKLLGFHVEGHSTTVEVTPQSFTEDVIVGVRMQVRYSVAPDGTGARVTHHLESRLPSGIAGKVLSLFLRWRLRKMQSMLLNDLVRHCEAADGGTAANLER